MRAARIAGNAAASTATPASNATTLRYVVASSRDTPNKSALTARVPAAAPHDERDDISWRRPKRRSHADLTDALRDAARQHAVDARRREQERGESERFEQDQREPPIRDRA